MDIYIYSSDKPTPRVKDIILTIAQACYPDEIINIKTKYYKDNPQRLLVFGKEAPADYDGEVIYTYSFPQIVSKRNTGFVLQQSFKLYFEGAVVPEFETFYEPKDLQRFDLSQPLALDIETDGDPFGEQMQEEVNLLSMSFYQPGVCVALDTKEWNENDFQQLTDFMRKVEKPLWHNGKFDLRVLKARTGALFNQYCDTMLMHHTVNSGAGMHGLEELAALYFGCEDYSTVLKKYTVGGAHFENIPTDILLKYNALDVFWTYQLYEFLKPFIDQDEDLRKSLWLEMQYSHYLLLIELNGLPWNETYIPEFSKIIDDRKSHALGFTQGITMNEEFNPSSPKQVKELFVGLGYNINKADAETLAEIQSTGDDMAALLAKYIVAYRQATKVKGTYIEGYTKRARNGRIHPAYKIHGTVTGRLSSGNPNVQNIPRDKAVKRAIGYQPGESENVIMAADYSQVELRTMAILSQDEWLINAFQPGSDDFFLIMMRAQFGEEYIKKMKKKDRDELRVKFKAVVYGLSYGRGAPAIAKDNDIPVEDAQAIIDNLFKSAPKFAQWRAKIHAAISDPEDDSTLTTIFGRKAQAEVVTPANLNNLERELISFLPQGTASDLTVISAIRMMRSGELEKYGYKVINLIHDCVLLEGPERHAEDVGRWVSYVMKDTAERALGTQVAFEAEADWAVNYGEIPD